MPLHWHPVLVYLHGQSCQALTVYANMCAHWHQQGPLKPRLSRAQRRELVEGTSRVLPQ